MSDLEERLRAELHRRAESAPGGTLLAERIIAAARTQPRPVGRRSWPTWTLPLLTAGAVAAIVTGVFVGVSQIRTDGAPAPALSHGGTFSPSVQRTSPAPTPTQSATVSPSTPPTNNPPPDNAVGLTNFVATDLTFYGTHDGWALGTADCIKSAGTCPAMVRTTDGGKTWHSMTQPPGGVTGLRFATPAIGYAFSDSVFEMTTNGGQSWTVQPGGGALALETLHGNVVRLVSPHSGCPGPCAVRAEFAPVGTSAWTVADFGPVDQSVQLVRSDADVYILATRNWAGGAPARSTLYVSTDNGVHWTEHGEPCPQTGGEVDSHSVAASPGGTVTVSCVPREAAPAFVAVSTDAGNHFTKRPGTVPWGAAGAVVGDPRTVLLDVGTGAYRSTDGGASWQRIAQITGEVTFAGFESATLGRIVTDGGRTIWTTTDAGRHWTPFTFSS